MAEPLFNVETLMYKIRMHMKPESILVLAIEPEGRTMAAIKERGLVVHQTLTGTVHSALREVMILVEEPIFLSSSK